MSHIVIVLVHNKVHLLKLRELALYLYGGFILESKYNKYKRGHVSEISAAFFIPSTLEDLMDELADNDSSLP